MPSHIQRDPLSYSGLLDLQQLVRHLRWLTRRMRELEAAHHDTMELIANLQQRLDVLEAAVANGDTIMTQASRVDRDEAVSFAHLILATHNIHVARTAAWLYLRAIGQRDTAASLTDQDCAQPPTM